MKIIYLIFISSFVLLSILSCERSTNGDPPSNNDDGDDSTSYLIVDVRDGDTIELDDGQAIRLVGINTPEMNFGGTPEPCAQEATDFTTAEAQAKRCYLVYNTPVGDSIDYYGRTLAFVHILPDSQCLNVEVCRAGWSDDWDDYPVRSDYECQFEEAEEEAIAADRGIWDSYHNCE
jgi:micrococcal nuclease